jgi:dolichol-phosphate mannosyltransferase
MDRSPVAPAATVRSRSRAQQALRARHNWVQLIKFSVVGGSGVVVNLAVFTALVHGAHVHYLVAAVCSFLVAVTSNYTWNHVWTFRGHSGRGVAYQGPRFLVVSLLALVANLLLLRGFVALGLAKVLAQAVAILLVMPVNFLGNKLWSFRRH